MIWILIYVVGMVVTAVLAGYLNIRDDCCKEFAALAEDATGIFFASLVWPILLMIGIFGGLAKIGKTIKNKQKK